MSNKQTFAERCQIAEECLPDTPYRAMLTKLHTEMLQALMSGTDGAEQAAQQRKPVNKYCCHLCFNKSGQMFLDRMILCPECGNKRCPKATHHDQPCTNSNEPGQPGSIYTTPQPPRGEAKLKAKNECKEKNT